MNLLKKVSVLGKKMFLIKKTMNTPLSKPVLLEKVPRITEFVISEQSTSISLQIGHTKPDQGQTRDFQNQTA